MHDQTVVLSEHEMMDMGRVAQDLNRSRLLLFLSSVFCFPSHSKTKSLLGGRALVVDSIHTSFKTAQPDPPV